MKRLYRLLVSLSVFSLARAASAYDITPVADPEALGFSSSRLARIAAWQQTQVDAKVFSGAVAAIARNGKVAYLRAVGFRDNARTSPLQPDAIFWIASMSKPVTSVAAMMLVEEGKLDLAAPVHQYLPELRQLMVGVEKKDPVSGRIELVREPQKRPMTVEDLLRHTAGLIYGVGDTKVDELYRLLYVHAGAWHRHKTLADFIDELATLPLAHQPGEVWDYGLSVDVLSRVVEVASGQPFDQFLETRLFKPLGMVDTGFYVSETKRSRLVDPPVGGRKGPPDSVMADVTMPTRFFAGGGGLASTTADYLRFCQMLLNGGELDGVRILAPATVKRMTTNALPPGIRFAGYVSNTVGPVAGTTWGLGFAVRNDSERSVVPGAVGSFSWSGTWGTYFWVDPAEQLIVVQMIQVPTGSGGPYFRSLRNLTYGALRVADQGVPPGTAQVAIDPAVEGTYRFASVSARDLQNEFGGLGVNVEITNGVLSVVSPIRDAPAAKAGVLAGDAIVKIDGEATQGMALNQAIQKMRGLVNTSIRLTIERKGQAIELTIVRGLIGVAGTELRVTAKDGKLQVEASGDSPILDFEKGAPVMVVPSSSTEFYVDGGDHTRLAFRRAGSGRIASLVLNPGAWQVVGQRID